MNGNPAFNPLALCVVMMQATMALQEMFFKPHMLFVLGTKPAQLALVGAAVLLPIIDLRSNLKPTARHA